MQGVRPFSWIVPDAPFRCSPDCILIGSITLVRVGWRILVSAMIMTYMLVRPRGKNPCKSATGRKGQVAELIRRAEAGEAIELTRYGRPVRESWPRTAPRSQLHRCIGGLPAARNMFDGDDEISDRAKHRVLNAGYSHTHVQAVGQVLNESVISDTRARAISEGEVNISSASVRDRIGYTERIIRNRRLAALAEKHAEAANHTDHRILVAQARLRGKPRDPTGNSAPMTAISSAAGLS